MGYNHKGTGAKVGTIVALVLDAQETLVEDAPNTGRFHKDIVLITGAGVVVGNPDTKGEYPVYVFPTEGDAGGSAGVSFSGSISGSADKETGAVSGTCTGTGTVAIPGARVIRTHEYVPGVDANHGEGCFLLP